MNETLGRPGQCVDALARTDDVSCSHGAREFGSGNAPIEQLGRPGHATQRAQSGVGAGE
jgi:hypothetical protein